MAIAHRLRRAVDLDFDRAAETSTLERHDVLRENFCCGIIATFVRASTLDSPRLS
jgi:hypothetical protein